MTGIVLRVTSKGLRSHPLFHLKIQNVSGYLTNEKVSFWYGTHAGKAALKMLHDLGVDDEMILFDEF